MKMATLLQRAFRLVYCLHTDRHIARRITWEALTRLDTYSTTQVRVQAPRSTRPYTLRLSKPLFLQAAVFQVSETWERDQEHDTPQLPGNLYPPTPDDLLVRYVKHLVAKTFNRMPRHLAIGLGCHLFQYRPEQINRLAPRVFNAANLRRDYSRRLSELTERFPTLDILTAPPYGAKAVCTRRPTAHDQELILRALEMLTPWGTRHKPPSLPLRQLFSDASPRCAWEQKHALLDPQCAGFGALIRAYNRALDKRTHTGLEDPDDNLAVPAFANGNGRSRSPHIPLHHRFVPTPLSDDALDLMLHHLQVVQRRRRQYYSGPLRVHIDAQEYAQLASRTTAYHQCEVPASASAVEIFGQDREGDLLLATYFLPDFEALDDGRITLFVTHAGGQTVKFDLLPRPESTGEGAVVRIASAVPRWKSLWTGVQKGCANPHDEYDVTDEQRQDSVGLQMPPELALNRP